MKTQIDLYDFKKAFKEKRSDNFSNAALEALYAYLCDYENNTGDEIELDVIALCCDYTEYSSIEEFNNDYSTEHESIEDIEQFTTVIDFENGFIIQNF